MEIQHLVDDAHGTAIEKGWHETKRTPLEIHALIHSEIAEATEAARSGLLPMVVDQNGKPQGEAIELADAVIRIADYFGSRGWSLQDAISMKMKYNETRPHRHGGKLY